MPPIKGGIIPNYAEGYVLMENERKSCIRCGNFLTEKGFCSLYCIEREIKEIRKYLIGSTLFAIAFVLVLYYFIGDATEVRTTEDMIWLGILYFLVFTMPFGRRRESAGLGASNSTATFSGHMFFRGTAKDGFAKEAAGTIGTTLAGFISYLGILHLPYKLFRLLELSRTRKELLYKEN